MTDTTDPQLQRILDALPPGPHRETAAAVYNALCRVVTRNSAASQTAVAMLDQLSAAHESIMDTEALRDARYSLAERETATANAARRRIVLADLRAIIASIDTRG